MQKYIAYYQAHGQTKLSGIVDRDAARTWANNALNGTKASKVLIAEIVETVEYSQPPIIINPFHPAGVPTHGDRLAARGGELLGRRHDDAVDGTRDGV